MPDVSVIIVNWNTKALLLACIRSIREHTHGAALEIIVVDNASADGSQQALRQTFPDVRLIQNTDNLGFAKANNIGIRASSGAYICLVNSDVEVKSGCIDSMKSYMDSHSDIGIMGPKVFYPDGGLQQSCKKFPSLWNSLCSALFLDKLLPGFKLFATTDTWYTSYDAVCSVDALIGAFWMIRRLALDQAGLLDELFYFYSEDIDWCKRFWAKGWKVVFFPKAEIVHYCGGSSKTAPLDYYIQLNRASLQYWKKHHSTPAVFFVTFIMLLHQGVRIFLGLAAVLLMPVRRNEICSKLQRSAACFKYLLLNNVFTKE